MMVVDTSALIAVVMKEDDGDQFLHALLSTPRKFMSAASVVEAAEVYARAFDIDDVSTRLFDDLKRLGIGIIDVSTEQAQIAVEARMKFGRGRHKAKLNYGDCFSYALAKVSDLPLLFKGRDFVLTDLVAVI